MGFRWVKRGHRVIDPADPDLRTIADVGYALGIRFRFDVRPVQYAWQGPWHLGRDQVWRRPYGPDGRVLEVPLPVDAQIEHMEERLFPTLLWMTRSIGRG